MQHFSIDKKNEVDKTFRVSKVMADFDVDPKHSNEHFEGDFDLPEKWNVGIIVGKSGTGKTTIAKDMFGEELISGFEYKNKSVIDDMPKSPSFKNGSEEILVNHFESKSYIAKSILIGVSKALNNCRLIHKQILIAKYLDDMYDWQIMQKLNYEKTRYAELKINALNEFADRLEVQPDCPNLHVYIKKSGNQTES